MIVYKESITLDKIPDGKWVIVGKLSRKVIASSDNENELLDYLTGIFRSGSCPKVEIFQKGNDSTSNFPSVKVIDNS